ncbi:TetR-like C-terminal domain-containing protein [Niveispirillum sp. BGYR6]|uniref:TetR/AcrR family transcriptional regulator n=1 Tax=Niveispirillum sp. BGYR6 TaxID=2971249 RepID=UPI0022B998B6|nr:TetR-like C-terminal domain-containing protein [Niveispirillum sp. BGYR6]MDG5497776.1 TetR-like C-terminal domain-containing protein [Niveispirillum sp. BGYR6]
MSRQPRAELAQVVLHEARRLVADQGLGALTARQLALSVGCSVGTLYNLYPNLDTVKLHLNAELLERLAVAVGAADLAAGGPQASPEQRLLAQARAYLAFASTHLNLYLALIDNRPPTTDEPVPDWFLEKVARLRRGVEAAIAPLIPDGDEARLERAATTIWASVNGLCEGIVSGNLARVSRTDPDLLMEELVATLAAGLRARG